MPHEKRDAVLNVRLTESTISKLRDIVKAGKIKNKRGTRPDPSQADYIELWIELAWNELKKRPFKKKGRGSK